MRLYEHLTEPLVQRLLHTRPNPSLSCRSVGWCNGRTAQAAVCLQCPEQPLLTLVITAPVAH